MGLDQYLANKRKEHLRRDFQWIEGYEGRYKYATNMVETLVYATAEIYPPYGRYIAAKLSPFGGWYDLIDKNGEHHKFYAKTLSQNKYKHIESITKKTVSTYAEKIKKDAAIKRAKDKAKILKFIKQNPDRGLRTIAASQNRTYTSLLKCMADANIDKSNICIFDKATRDTIARMYMDGNYTSARLAKMYSTTPAHIFNTLRFAGFSREELKKKREFKRLMGRYDSIDARAIDFWEHNKDYIFHIETFELYQLAKPLFITSRKDLMRLSADCGFKMTNEKRELLCKLNNFCKLLEEEKLDKKEFNLPFNYERYLHAED